MDRELYDLCRRYNYYYRKYRDTKELSYKYYDERLNDVVRSMGCDLSIHEDNLIGCILKKLDLDKCQLEIEMDMDVCHYMNGSHYLPRNENIEIIIKNNKKFADALQRTIMVRRKL